MGRLTEIWATDKHEDGITSRRAYLSTGKDDTPVAVLDKAPRPKTPQQIAAHCDKIEGLMLTAYPDGKLLFDSVQIINQLQAVIE